MVLMEATGCIFASVPPGIMIWLLRNCDYKMMNEQWMKFSA